MRYNTTQGYFLKPYRQDLNFLILPDLSSVSKKSVIFELIYSAQLNREYNSYNQIEVYYDPCNQNTKNHFGSLKLSSDT